jgi:hypothetical protein
MAWAPNYATVEELTTFRRVGDDLDDVQAGLAISAASRAVDRATKRQFGIVDVLEARYYTAQYDAARGRWVANIDDLMTTTGMAVAFDTDDDLVFGTMITTYRKLPANAAAENRPWTELVFASGVTDLENGVKVTAMWGWTTVPDPIKQATLLQANRLLSRRDSPYGIAGSPTQGSELRLLAKVDPDVEVALQDYKRKSWAFV